MHRWLWLIFHFTVFDLLDADCVIEENSRAFVPVCDIKKIFPDIEAPNVDNFPNIFRLNGNNLELLQSLDRENLIANQRCDTSKIPDYNFNGQCVLLLELSAAGPRFFQLSILVADINDNVPSFDRLYYNIKIPENSPSNIEVDLPQARDLDRGNNGSVTYSLQKTLSSHKFVLLNPSSNGALDSPLKLKILQPFDREAEEYLELILIAKDQGYPSLSSSLIIKIEVTDVNDHPPEFNQTSYLFNIPESILQGQPIGRVFATDKDVSSRVIVMMSPSASSQIMDRFVVASDGVISTKMSLEYTSSNYDLRIPVIAVDGGAPSLTATTTVFVHITDVNDNSPIIEVTSSNPNNRLLLLENCPPNTYIAKITVKDKDYGVNGQVDCRLDNYLFNIEPLQNFENRRYYKLNTAPLSIFDRETKDSHVVNIICHDKGIPPLTSSRPINIQIKDENDNPPIFPQSHQSVKISENQPSGTRVITLKATDRDIGMNSQTKYKLFEESLQLFNIDPFTGVVTTSGSFDREKVDTFKLKATAYDSLRPALHSNVTVHITIQDENDNHPRFTKGLTFHVKENTEGIIGRIEAVDNDEGKNKEIEFFLQTTMEIFQLSKAGEILVSRKFNLDREKVDHYTLEVIAKDKGQRPLTSSTLIEIVVDDVNDNYPVFHLPQPGHQTNISVSTPPGTRVFTTEAVDHDSGVNSKIIYWLRPQGVFVINSSDGGIFLNRTISNDIDLPLKLIIYAKDGGTPSLTSTTSLIVNYVHNGIINPIEPDKRTEARVSTSRDLVLSLGIGMVLLIFTCLMLLVTYFCVSIFIQKRRHQLENESKGRVGIESQTSHWLCFCRTSSDNEDSRQEARFFDKANTVPRNSSIEIEQNYPLCLNRWDRSREEDPFYGYREFTMKPIMAPTQNPIIYDRLTTLPQSINPYWQYNTVGHMSQRPSYPTDSDHGNQLQEMVYHHGTTYIPQNCHPDLVNSSSSDDANKLIYGELSPSLVPSTMKLSLFSQSNYENEKMKFGSNTNLSSMEMLCQQNDADQQSTARFAGYVVGSPRYANSFV